MILVVDDEPAIRESLVYALEREGFATRQARNLADARDGLAGTVLIILDLMLPDGNGLDFLREIRKTSDLPVIVLTSRDDEIDCVVGLEIGADDYVTKPFSPREVVARVRAVLRRAGRPEARTDERLSGPAKLTLEPSARRAWVGEEELQLSKTEFDLLAVFLGAPGRVFERRHLLSRVWGTDTVVGDRTVDVHLKALRQKIADVGGDATAIETVRGVGYRLRGRGG